MKVVCYVCDIVYGHKEGEGISHGICEPCFDDLMKRMDEEEACENTSTPAMTQPVKHKEGR